MQNPTPDSAALSDSELFSLCRRHGKDTLLARRKFEGLLPEVERRKLYDKKGFRDIFHFAAVLAGLSENQVRRVVNVERSLADKPALRSLLVSGEVSVNKLARVVSVATPQNEGVLAEQSRLLSSRALETLVRDERFAQKACGSKNENGLFVQEIKVKSVHVHTSTPQLSDAVKQRLTGMQGKGIDINALLTELLDGHERELAEKKERFAEEQEDAAIAREQMGKIEKKPSRHIPVAIKRLITREYGTKCATPTCQKPSQTLHHTARFALTGSHNPHYLAPLCKEHHQIAHTIDEKYHEKRTAR